MRKKYENLMKKSFKTINNIKGKNKNENKHKHKVGISA